MADDDLIIYYFDGEDGCDLCNVLTGYSFDDALQPHPECDCVVECIDMATEGDCYFELRDAEWAETYDEIVDESTHRVPCHAWEHDIEFEMAVVEVNNLSSELEELAANSGWAPPDAENTAISYTVPSFTDYYVTEMTMKYYYADIEATLYMVCELEGNTSEMEIETEYGDYCCIYSFENELTDTDSCIGL